jgi:hypothetical protein
MTDDTMNVVGTLLRAIDALKAADRRAEALSERLMRAEADLDAFRAVALQIGRERDAAVSRAVLAERQRDQAESRAAALLASVEAQRVARAGEPVEFDEEAGS